MVQFGLSCSRQLNTTSVELHDADEVRSVEQMAFIVNILPRKAGNCKCIIAYFQTNINVNDNNDNNYFIISIFKFVSNI